MDELKKQILGFKDWDASKKGRALNRFKERISKGSLACQTMSCRLHSMMS